MEGTYRTGQFVWRELICPDVAKAKGFYGELLNWTFRDSDMGSFVYTLAMVGEQMVGGFMPTSAMPPGQAPPPSWTSYASVTDVDATIKLAEENGGMAPMKPETVPGVGRFGVIGDPTGAFLGILRQEQGDAPGAMPPALGTFCWETLNTTDAEKATAFYTKVMGWSVGAGPGSAAVFTAGEAQVANVSPVPPGAPSHWLSHVVVEKLEPAREKAARLGATVLMPVVDVPSVGRLCIIQDPLGAVLSLFEPGPMPAT